MEGQVNGKEWAMIIAKLKSGALSWHVVTRVEGDFRLVCDTTKVVVPKVMGNYDPNRLLCENCKEALNRLDLGWRRRVEKDMAQNVSIAGLKASQNKIDFQRVVQSLVKKSRGPQ